MWGRFHETATPAPNAGPVNDAIAIDLSDAGVVVVVVVVVVVAVVVVCVAATHGRATKFAAAKSGGADVDREPTPRRRDAPFMAAAWLRKTGPKKPTQPPTTRPLFNFVQSLTSFVASTSDRSGQVRTRPTKSGPIYDDPCKDDVIICK